MKIAILGTRGIPNQYGGFEQLAQYLSLGLVKKGHEVYVYSPHNHLYKEKSWNGVNIIHCYDPESRIGTAGQFIYDLNCILDSRKRNFHVLLMLGYTSSSIWGPLYPKNSTILFNMDGMEAKRSKYSTPVKKFLSFAERLAIQFSNFVIADSRVIKSYLDRKYDISSRYIAYGAQVFANEEEAILKNYKVSRGKYFMSIGRMVSENNLEIILDGFTSSDADAKFLVVSNPANKFGQYLVDKYREDSRILFPGTIYDQEKTHSLKRYSSLYFHGHSVGGTNPCLLEAMASQSLIAAHDNEFNRSILNEDAYYFSTPSDVKELVENISFGEREREMVKSNFYKVTQQFNWENIIDEYERFMIECCNQFYNERSIYHKRYTYK